MGSGDRFTIYRTGAFGAGVHISRFPFSVSISITFLFWGMSLGFGKGYDE